MRLSCLVIMFCLAFCDAPARAAENPYGSGRIVLQPDPSYGQETEWAKVFPAHDGKNALIAVAGDGSCFVLDGLAYRIHKFGPAGDLQMSWGKKGRKPGEFSSQPRSLILLDNQFVLAADTSMGRINVYDLNGRYIKMLQVDFPVHKMVPLAGGKFAVASVVGAGEGSRQLVAVLSLDGSKEKIIASRVRKVERVTARSKENSILVSMPFNLTYSFIDRTREGNLIYGVSDRPELILYSPEGQKLGMVALNLTSMPVAAEEQAKARKSMLKKLEDLKSRFGEIEVRESPHAFEGNTPYFTRLLVDGTGNAMVFKFSKDNQRRIQIYQIRGNAGRMTGEVSLEPGGLGSFDNVGAMAIHQSFLYAVANLKGGQSGGWRLVRIPWIAAAK